MSYIPVPEELLSQLASRPGRLDFSARTHGEFVVWQETLRTALKDALGLGLMESMTRVPPDSCLDESVACEGYVRQKWSIATEPGVRVPFYLLLPAGAGLRPEGRKCRRPVVLALPGHGPGKVLPAGVEPSEGERDYGVQAVRRGYIALVPELRGFGELMRADDRKEGKTWSCRTRQMHALLFGRCLIGERTWDLLRLIDWLLTRDDVDSGRIAVTGNSGGGMVALFAAACETRIAAAVPSCYFCTFFDSIVSIHHCECNYVPGILNLGEMWNVGGLVAPRPMLVVAGREDPIFPIAGFERSYERLARIYQVAGASDNLEQFIGSEGHRYYPERVWPFLAERLGNPS